MNLSTKQIQALVRELQPVIRAKQEEQLASIKESVRNQCIEKVKSLELPFDIVGWRIKGLEFDNKLLCDKLWVDIDYNSRKCYSSEEEIVNYMYSKSINKNFIATFWKEIKSEDIEHEIIIWTIWADTVQALMENVKAKLIG